MAKGNILVRLSGRLSIRERGKSERQIELFHELRKLKIGAVDRKLLEPPADFDRAKAEIDLSHCR